MLRVGFYKKDSKTPHFVSTIQRLLPLAIIPFRDSIPSPILSQEMEVRRRHNRSSQAGESLKQPDPNPNHDTHSHITNALFFISSSPSPTSSSTDGGRRSAPPPLSTSSRSPRWPLSSPSSPPSST